MNYDIWKIGFYTTKYKYKILNDKFKINFFKNFNCKEVIRTLNEEDNIIIEQKNLSKRLSLKSSELTDNTITEIYEININCNYITIYLSRHYFIIKSSKQDKKGIFKILNEFINIINNENEYIIYVNYISHITIDKNVCSSEILDVNHLKKSSQLTYNNEDFTYISNNSYKRTDNYITHILHNEFYTIYMPLEMIKEKYFLIRIYLIFYYFNIKRV